jgi:PIN domain nuclease of toxin-antitoxin system
VRLLLDTHALLWWWTDDPQLSAVARAAIAEERNIVMVSAASVWEIATKHRLGKLAIGAVALKQLHALVEGDGFQHLPITWQHSLLAGSFAQTHRDPFDRMLAAQSELEQARLVSCDAAFGAFGSQLLW